MSAKPLRINLSDQGQMFAGVATIRNAIFDVLDHGDQDEQKWAFYEDNHEESEFRIWPWTEDMANSDRSNFADAVIARIATLQSLAGGVRLENLCDKHKRQLLPVPTAAVCGMCQAERGK